VIEIGGGAAKLELESGRLKEVGADEDPSIALSGQVGGHVKLEVGHRWLLANVRGLKMHEGEAGTVIADIDFLGEGEEHPQSGRLVNFRRGITGYPTPGARVFPGSGEDMKQMFAADERPTSRSAPSILPPTFAARLRRRDARQAFRAARLHRHRQIDRPPR
jgi:hypothetical protein